MTNDSVTGDQAAGASDPAAGTPDPADGSPVVTAPDRPAPDPGPSRGSARASRAGVAALALVALALLVAAIAAGVLLVQPMAPLDQAAAVASATPPPAGQSPVPSLSDTAPPNPSPTPSPTVAPTPSVPSPSALPDVPAAALQARLDQLRTKLSIPGASVAILWDDGRRWLGASGSADIKRKVPMTTGTGFAFASISKTFTAAVALQLVEEGRLGLDQQVAPLLPAFKLDSRMTVRQLLDHTSGLPDYFLNAKINKPLQAAPNATWAPLKTWAYLPVKHPAPGKQWIYSNANYLLLGLLVEEVTGHPLATEVRTRLLDPLGLGTAWYQADEKPRAPRSVGYRLLAKSGGGLRAVPIASGTSVMPFRSVVTAAGGAGSIAGTALDAALWMQAYAGGDVLTPAMHAAQLADMEQTAALKARIPYGLGIQGVPIAGHAALGHSGRFLGFRTVVRYLPDDGVTIAVLTNQGVQDPAKIAAALLKIVLPPVGPSASASPSPSAVPGASPSASATPSPAASPGPSSTAP